ncbi:hypothetical protein KY337_02490 [Candidatus Woesearchaeota archaeon]|nr:hypothetical protein [Candidatus Woesearchaeota archaeon]
MKRTLLILSLMILILVGCQQPTKSGEVQVPYHFGESYYEGTPRVGNEIIVNLIATTTWTHPDNPFYTINWDNIEITTYESKEKDKPIELVTDLFEIDKTRINIIKEEKKVTVSIPTKILRDGKGAVRLDLGENIGGIRGSSIWIETEGYIPPEQPPLPEYCKDLPPNVECAVEVSTAE